MRRSVPQGTRSRGRQQEAPLRVLVTGHNGYIGIRAGTAAPAGGPRGRRPRLGPVRGLHLRRRARRIESTPGNGRPRRPERGPRRLRRGHPPRGACRNDPVGNLNPEATYDDQPHGLGARWPRRPRRRASRASCSRPRAACTARPATSCSTRAPTSTRSRRTASRRCCAEQDISPARRRRLQPDLPAQRDGLRRLAAAARSTSSSTTWSATRSPRARS